MSFLVNFLVFSNFKIVYTIRISTFFYNFLIEASLYQFYIFFHFGGSIYYNFLFENSLYLFLPMSSYYTIPAHCVWEVVYGRRLLSLKLCVSSKMNYAHILPPGPATSMDLSHPPRLQAEGAQVEGSSRLLQESLISFYSLETDHWRGPQRGQEILLLSHPHSPMHHNPVSDAIKCVTALHGFFLWRPSQ